MPSLLQIVTNTPLWVWPLMLFVLWLGWLGLKPRVMTPARLAILPLVGLSTSFVGIVQSARPLLAAAGWLGALLLALPLGYLIGNRRAVRPTADGKLEVAGGWFVLVFAISIFVVRYSLGVTFGVFPALKADPFWIVAAGGVGGVIAGIGLGWLASLVLRFRRFAAAAS